MTVVLILVISGFAFAQNYDDYVRELKKAESKSFDETDLEHIFRNFGSIVMPEMGVTELRNTLEGRPASEFPLASLKAEKFYRASMNRFFKSSNQHRRILACITVASANDSSFNDILRKQMKSDSDKNCRMWSGMALLYLKDNHTSELFDFLVANEDFGDAHLIPLYLRLDKNALEQTAYEKIESADPKARILAVQSLSATGLNPKTDEVVRKAVQTWENEIKGYAIYAMKALHMGHLKPILRPLLQSKELKRISLEALSNSPSVEDKECLESFVTDSETPEEVLDALFKSDDQAMVSKWLTTVRDKSIPEKYVFFVFEQPLLGSDNLLGLVRDTIRKTKNRQIVQELPRALKGRRDEESLDLLTSLLADPDSTVRYWAAFTLKGASSPKLIASLPDLIRNPGLRTVALTDLAIENKVGTLADVYRGMLKDGGDLTTDWRRSAVQYLAAFPQSEDVTLFRSILESKEDPFAIRMAAQGLGNLGDLASVDSIIKVMREEAAGSDLNARVYLVALSAIKGDKARTAVESFMKSKEESVRDLAATLIQTWNPPAGEGIKPDYTSTAVVNESFRAKPPTKPSATPVPRR